MIDEIRKHSSQILAHIARGEQMIPLQPPAEVRELTAARAELVAALSAYSLFKHASIFYPLINGQGLHAARAREMKANCIAANEAFRHYAMKWNATNVLTDWDRYRTEAFAMIERIRAHLQSESRALTHLVIATGMQNHQPRGYGARPRPDAVMQVAVGR